ncbi:DegT/DnrJ/EryC1/StrS family aminotransferase [Haloarcula sp. GH36]|uniref:DegT/DnrJ/EryC1/StrS family aminotransferase n=1 Tax=Haloarcula montana TaxID=3111776 RepID=UPI002D78F126|nr:DegT/DnrJ/EryC1/StrS family aminotransferase [Haloarcula sp. GH36]
MLALTESLPLGLTDIFSPSASDSMFPEPLLELTGFQHSQPYPSCRTAIVGALQAAEIGSEQEVLVPGYTCYAVQRAVEQVTTPVYVDVTEEYTMDLTHAARQMSPDTAAILPTHLFGTPCNMIEIAQFATEHDLVVIEDAAQAIGTLLNSDQVAQYSDYCTFSFRFYKDATAFGSGLLLSPTPGPSPSADGQLLDQRLQLIGIKLFTETMGALPGRLYRPLRERVLDPIARSRSDAVEPAEPTALSRWQRRLLDHQLDTLPERVRTRQNHADRYAARLPDGIDYLEPADECSYFRFPIQVASELRDPLSARLRERGVGCSKMYSYTVAPEGTCQTADRLADGILNLPIHAGIDRLTIDRIAEITTDVYRELDGASGTVVRE